MPQGVRGRRPANPTESVDFAGRLALAAVNYQAAEQAMTAATVAREEAIRNAHEGGMSMRAIAEHAAISHQRVGQILNA